jgi:hypothetical protein
MREFREIMRLSCAFPNSPGNEIFQEHYIKLQGKVPLAETLDFMPPKFADQMGDGGERPGINQKGEALPSVEPGADELAEAFEGRLIEIDAEEIFHDASLEGGWERS